MNSFLESLDILSKLSQSIIRLKDYLLIYSLYLLERWEII